MPIIKLQPEHMALCEEHARAVMKNRSERSRAVSWRGGAKDNLAVQINGRACEWATATYFGLDPRKVLNWDSSHGDETDLHAAKKNIDVKGTQNPKAVLLIYSCEITQYYLEKNFDTLLFARACPLPVVELVGWISKTDFYRICHEAPRGPYGKKLDPGTWYVHKDELHPIKQLDPPRDPVVHRCWCGKWGAFGYGVRLLQDQPGEWFCFEHRPKDEIVQHETNGTPTREGNPNER